MATSESAGELSPVAAAFAAHLQAFHQQLPAEEQALLEQLLALAQGSPASEVQGHGLAPALGGGLFFQAVNFLQAIKGQKLDTVDTVEW